MSYNKKKFENAIRKATRETQKYRTKQLYSKKSLKVIYDGSTTSKVEASSFSKINDNENKNEKMYLLIGAGTLIFYYLYSKN